MNEELKRSRYAVPIAVTVATHAFLFFGFNRPESRPPPATPPAEAIAVTPFPPPPEDLIPTPAGDAADTSRSSPTVGPPRGPDIPVPFHGPAIEMPWVPVAPGPADPRITAIPVVGEPGLPGERFTDVLRAIDLDNPPRVKFRHPPEYPYSLKASGISGEVWVEFIVDEEGRVVSPRVTRSSHSDFDVSTLRAVAKWRFESGKRHGRPVRFRMSIPVVYSIGGH